MSVKKEQIAGKMIYTSIKSTSLKSASYDTLNENLRVLFNNGTAYEYKQVPSTTFTKFRLAKSQGKFFNQNISKNFTYKKVKSI